MSYKTVEKIKKYVDVICASFKQDDGKIEVKSSSSKMDISVENDAFDLTVRLRIEKYGSEYKSWIYLYDSMDWIKFALVNGARITVSHVGTHADTLLYYLQFKSEDLFDFNCLEMSMWDVSELVDANMIVPEKNASRVDNYHHGCNYSSYIWNGSETK